MIFEVEPSGMKKKTVITTEKQEVWVVRQSSGVTEEQREASQESDASNESLIVQCDQDADQAELLNQDD